ncbi:DUF397 domain-containing protein [Streptomyces sp. NPDC091377]|uniref:DUF397 domain-containing protein n=1 Tax=Streptomyces sp. NPDC091377 TaxID=3365995 RepID=UPI0037F12230
MDRVPRLAPGSEAWVMQWFKSSYSGADDGDHDCVEVAVTPKTIHVRDSKHTDGDRLTVTREEWTAFLGSRLAWAHG